MTARNGKLADGTVIRYLACDQCPETHLLAGVFMFDGEWVFDVNTTEPRNIGGHLRSDARAKGRFIARAADVPNMWTIRATCGCRDNHQIDLRDLLRRAQEGDTRPNVVQSVRN